MLGMFLNQLAESLILQTAETRCSHLRDTGFNAQYIWPQFAQVLPWPYQHAGIFRKLDSITMDDELPTIALQRL